MWALKQALRDDGARSPVALGSAEGSCLGPGVLTSADLCLSSSRVSGPSLLDLCAGVVPPTLQFGH